MRLINPAKPLFSLKPLDATTWLRSLLSEVFRVRLALRARFSLVIISHHWSDFSTKNRLFCSLKCKVFLKKTEPSLLAFLQFQCVLGGLEVTPKVVTHLLLHCVVWRQKRTTGSHWHNPTPKLIERPHTLKLHISILLFFFSNLHCFSTVIYNKRFLDSTTN